MSDRFTFVGHEPSYGYMHYRDLDTGYALVAEPGKSYRIAATEERYPVPPEDGRWAAAAKVRVRAKTAGDDTPDSASTEGGE